MAENVTELSEADFSTQIKSGVTLVDFWAPWCGPCRAMGPIVEKVAARVAGKAKVAKLNVDEAPNVAVQYSIQSIPTLIVFKDGSPVKQFVGVRQEKELVGAIEAAQ